MGNCRSQTAEVLIKLILIFNVLISLFYFQYSSVPDNVLYDANLLKNLDFESLVGVFSPPITATEPGEPWLLVRPLELEDFHKGFVQLLTQLTAVGNINQNEFERK